MAMALALHAPFTRLLRVTASKRTRGVGLWGMDLLLHENYLFLTFAALLSQNIFASSHPGETYM